MYASKIVKLVSSSSRCCAYLSNVSQHNRSFITLKCSLSVINRKIPYYLHNSFSTTSRSDDNVSKDKKTKKRRRILSSSDSSADESNKSQLKISNNQ